MAQTEVVSQLVSQRDAVVYLLRDDFLIVFRSIGSQSIVHIAYERAVDGHAAHVGKVGQRDVHIGKHIGSVHRMRSRRIRESRDTQDVVGSKAVYQHVDIVVGLPQEMHILACIVFHHVRRVEFGSQPLHTVNSRLLQQVALRVGFSQNEFHVQVYRIGTACIAVHLVHIVEHCVNGRCRNVLS